jgi:hypothetical protein
VYRIATSRGSDVLTTVLGATFAGILGSDRLPAYLKYVVGQGCPVIATGDSRKLLKRHEIRAV